VYAFISGFRVAFVLAVMPFASTSHWRMSSGESFFPTSSSGPFAFPFPAIEWHSEHFWSVKNGS
jgi:hypothetical protein